MGNPKKERIKEKILEKLVSQRSNHDHFQIGRKREERIFFLSIQNLLRVPRSCHTCKDREDPPTTLISEARKKRRLDFRYLVEEEGTQGGTRKEEKSLDVLNIVCSLQYDKGNVVYIDITSIIMMSMQILE